ncbi:hypothetical protein DYB35_003711 [Aphanomyces astaci]|uniref:Uncharacterized protein n=1 Tax=Aphanomyces astaci TaxID=112090 RepID=A0A3R7A3L0_APHAT|nr:hypothetical protein DYB35_003711 [Aphanomyces astaci]
MATTTKTHKVDLEVSSVYLSTDMQVSLLRELLKWFERRVCACYARVKAANLPIVPVVVAATEIVAVRVGIPRFVNSLAHITEPWISSIDGIVGGRFLSTITFIVRTCCPHDANNMRRSTDAVNAQSCLTVDQLKDQLVRVQAQLAMETQAKDALHATVCRVLATMTAENDSLEALCHDAPSRGSSAGRIKALEDELHALRVDMASVMSENDQLRRELAAVSSPSSTSKSEFKPDMTQSVHDQDLSDTSSSIDSSSVDISPTSPPQAGLPMELPSWTMLPCRQSCQQQSTESTRHVQD